MALEEYRKKRNFNETSEPGPQKRVSAGELPRFVIQKHQASHLHYDLRLEVEGVLKSWAVPKGPSLVPGQKRLAMMVEDHPFDYRNFEGIIPEGNYGAGTVMIWDEGFYSVPGIEGKKRTEEVLNDGIAKGNAVFSFLGQKVRGMFHLVRMSGRGENAWLLLKKSDEFASEKDDILQQDRSVRSDLSLEEIRTLGTAREVSINSQYIQQILADAPKKELDEPVKPMLAHLVEEPFDKEGWYFEIKWDGYRAIAECLHGAVRLYSRNNQSFAGHYPLIVQELKKIPFEVVLDGEVVVLDKNGRSDFGALQNYRRAPGGNLVYYVFDILHFEGHDLTGLPLYKRKELLKQVLPELERVKLNWHIENNGIEFYRGAEDLGLEGVVAKDSGSPYITGGRSWYWRKIKIVKQQEAVVGGFTEPKGGRKGLGSLIVGVYDQGKLVYAGHVGGGFSDQQLHEVRARLEKLEIDECPFEKKPLTSETSHWVKPDLVCMVRFSEWTGEGSMRHPVFQGFREDIDPASVVREEPSKPEPRFAPLKKDQNLLINGKSVTVSNPDKIYWPDRKITKGQMVDYYRNVAAWILPHLVDRPQSLHRFPDGIEGKHFFHKDMETVPEWASTAVIESEEGKTRYFLCQDEASLVYIVNLGTIEINPWISRVGSLENPDVMVIDLDPLACPFAYVIKAANMVHSVLSEIDVPHYVKTSGATGLHIFVPLEARYTYEQARQFALIVCTAVNRELPEITSLERLPSRRGGKVYLDFLQNTKGKTMASVYSLRPFPGAPVSTPLHWEEVNGDLDPVNFNIDNTVKRLEKTGDLWKPVLGRGINMEAALERLKVLFSRYT